MTNRTKSLFNRWSRRIPYRVFRIGSPKKGSRAVCVEAWPLKMWVRLHTQLDEKTAKGGFQYTSHVHLKISMGGRTLYEATPLKVSETWGFCHRLLLEGAFE